MVRLAPLRTRWLTLAGAAAVCVLLPARALASSIEGVWKTPRRTVAEMIAGGISPHDARTLWRTVPAHTGAEFRAGSFWAIDFASGQRKRLGSYALAGNVIRFRYPRGCCGGVTRPGNVDVLRWSVYRGTLVFSELPGRNIAIWWVLKPFIRVR
jgi:hypothetical protein